MNVDKTIGIFNVTHCLPMNGPTITAIIPKITEYKPNAEGNL